MGFLDWLKRGGNKSAERTARDVTLSSDAAKNLFAEWRQDHGLAKRRNETGREPEYAPPEAEAKPKSKNRTTQPERERVKGHDSPF
jgi:hypothetical protein